MIADSGATTAIHMYLLLCRTVIRDTDLHFFRCFPAPINVGLQESEFLFELNGVCITSSEEGSATACVVDRIEQIRLAQSVSTCNEIELVTEREISRFVVLKMFDL